MEFYIWGSAELEDMLHLPKNDRILFTFFGVSLVSRRRSRTTEVRSVVTVKNKLYKVIGEPGHDFSTSVLIRDIGDDHYPFKAEYPDFAVNPRWIAHEAFGHHPLGFWVHRRKFFAYVDRDANEFDFTDEADLLFTLGSFSEEEELRNRDGIRRLKKVVDFLPRSKQGYFHLDALVRYDDVFVIDPEGDGLYKCPHVYVDFSSRQGPYAGRREYLSVSAAHIALTDEWRRIDYFKTAVPVMIKAPAPQNTRAIELDSDTLKAHFEYRKDAESLYAIDNRYKDFQ